MGIKILEEWNFCPVGAVCKGNPPKERSMMNHRRTLRALVATALAGSLFAVAAPTAQAHVSVYVAGMSGVAIDTTTTNATYLVGFAPGHGCSGPRTASNPEGVYETTSLEVFMPRAASGAFILPEVRVIHGLGYKATLKHIPDPADATKKRVSSIVFDNFRLQAINNGYTARDAQLFTIAVRLPRIADVKAANYGYASGSAASLGARVYFPTMQYCDVTDQGVGILASSSTPATLDAKVDPVCNANDSIQTTLFDDWRTVGNTPSLVIGTSTSNVFEISGNRPTVAAAAADAYCTKPGGFNPRDLPLAGKFSAALSGKKGAKVLTLRAADSALNEGRTYRVVTPKGTVLGSAKVKQNGTLRITVRGGVANRLADGTSVRLMWGKKVLATDVA
jgi:hypothetical protein